MRGLDWLQRFLSALTVFLVVNDEALQFYKGKLRYQVDPTSPGTSHQLRRLFKQTLSVAFPPLIARVENAPDMEAEDRFQILSKILPTPKRS